MRNLLMIRTPQKNNRRRSSALNNYDAIYEQQSSSNRESLLVSPHSKLSRVSPSKLEESFDSMEKSMNRYTRPFESPDFSLSNNRMNTLRITSPDTDRNIKPTEPDFIRLKDAKKKSLQAKINELQAIIRQKDKKIHTLENQINGTKTALKVSNKNLKSSVSPQKNHLASVEDSKEERRVQSLRRQIIFLTQNNLQLFQQVHRLSNICQQAKQKILRKSVEQKNLQAKVVQLMQQLQFQKQRNQQLVGQKKQMMKNYEEQIKLFLKMKEVWKLNYGKQKKGEENPEKTCKRSYHQRRISK